MTESSSPVRRSRLKWVAAPFTRAGRWFGHLPRAVKYGSVAVLVIGLAGGAYFGESYLSKRQKARAVASAWTEYGRAVGRGDSEAIRTALDQVLVVAPGDPTALRYQAMLASGEADPDTPELAYVLLNQHLNNGRVAEAAREAEKVLARNPKDWQARCTVAHHALQILKDKKLAAEQLELLPDPEDKQAGVGVGGVRYALWLFHEVGHDASKLRSVIARRLVPLMRSRAAEDAAAAAKVGLLDCYLEAFDDPTLIGGLSEYWADADKLAERAVEQSMAAGDLVTLTRLAALGSRMRHALVALRDDNANRLPDERFRQFVKIVDERTRRVWLAIRDKAPDRSDAYRGLAELAFLANDGPGVIKQIMDGLAACGDRVELLELKARLISSHGTQAQLQEFGVSLCKAAEEAKTDPAKWCLAASAQIILDRMDLAGDACARAMAIRRDHPAACQIAAWLCVRTGSPVKYIEARELLARLGAEALRANPALSWLNARAMVGSGLSILLDDEFQSVLKTQAQLRPKTNAPAIGFLLGVFDAEPDLARAEWVAKKADDVLAGDPRSAAARRLRALALFRLADLTVTTSPDAGPPVWVGDRVTAALQSFDGLPPDERSEPALVAEYAKLLLKANNQQVAALRAASALRAAEGSLTSGQLEIYGSILTANKQPAEAVRVLERARLKPRPSAGLRIALAEAYQMNNQPIDARAELARAEASPSRSPLEQAELIALKKRLFSEK